MATLKEAVDDFLGLERLAVAGVSRTSASAANGIYKKLKGAGYTVYPTNPKALEIEGDTCYPDLTSIPGGVQGVVIATHPAAALGVVQECAALGIDHVWFHRSFGDGSYAEEAVTFCRENNIRAIPGGCPMMFVEKVDFGHKCIKWFMGVTGGLPKEV
jgi:predicted CoA-binding protein